MNRGDAALFKQLPYEAERGSVNRGAMARKKFLCPLLLPSWRIRAALTWLESVDVIPSGLLTYCSAEDAAYTGKLRYVGHNSKYSSKEDGAGW